MNKAIFFDRDGTINIDINYLHRPEDLKYFPDTFEALKLIDELGYQKFIITNQSGIGRGFYTATDFDKVHQQIQLDCVDHQVLPFTDTKYCPHKPDEGCSCRKPHPQMVLDLAQTYQIDLKKSWMIGDKLIDVQCGENAGAQGALVYSAAQEKISRFETLLEFALFLQKQP